MFSLLEGDYLALCAGKRPNETLVH
jgi:hypothetical protein